MNESAPDVPSAESVCQCVTEAAGRELENALAKIKHCLAQLSDEQVWWRAEEEQNSVANLILHLCGNLRQWIICGLGNLPDDRRRQQEFNDRSRLSKEELLARLEATVAEAQATLQQLTPAEMLRVRHVQEFDVTGAEAIFDSVPHFRGHTQEIIHFTRRLKGSDYQFSFVPKSPE